MFFSIYSPSRKEHTLAEIIEDRRRIDIETPEIINFGLSILSKTGPEKAEVIKLRYGVATEKEISEFNDKLRACFNGVTSAGLEKYKKFVDLDEMRIHLDNGGVRPPYTLAQIGMAIGLTRERVRQIESEALKELRFHLRRELKILE